ncbi:MAG: tetratricopeptide repeat protein [Gemmatimonadaceae bacterium]
MSESASHADRWENAPESAGLDTAISLTAQGQRKFQDRDFIAAEVLLRRSLEIRERIPSAISAGLLPALSELAGVYLAQNKLDRAEPLLERALAGSEQILGPRHAELAPCLSGLAQVYFKRGKFEPAERLLSRLLALKQGDGEENAEVATVLASLATVQEAAGRNADAEALWRRVLAIRERTLAPDALGVALALEHLADRVAAAGSAEEALAYHQRALAIRERTLGQDHRSVQMERAKIAALRLDTTPLAPLAVYDDRATPAADGSEQLSSAAAAEPPAWAVPRTPEREPNVDDGSARDDVAEEFGGEAEREIPIHAEPALPSRRQPELILRETPSWAEIASADFRRRVEERRTQQSEDNAEGSGEEEYEDAATPTVAMTGREPATAQSAAPAIAPSMPRTGFPSRPAPLSPRPAPTEPDLDDLDAEMGDEAESAPHRRAPKIDVFSDSAWPKTRVALSVLSVIALALVAFALITRDPAPRAGARPGGVAGDRPTTPATRSNAPSGGSAPRPVSGAPVQRASAPSGASKAVAQVGRSVAARLPFAVGSKSGSGSLNAPPPLAAPTVIILRDTRPRSTARSRR